MLRVLVAATAASLAVLAAAVPARAAEPAGFLTVPGCDFLDPSVCLLPWPNDFFTKADGATDTGRRLDLQVTAMPRNIAGKPIDPTEYNRNDGFSPGTPILVRIPGMDDDEAFARSGIVPQTDIARAFDRHQPVVLIDTETHKRHPVFAELDQTTANDHERVLIIRPARNLEEGRRYVVALRDLRDSEGRPIEAQRPFRVYRDRIAVLDPLVEARRRHMEEIFADLERARIAREDLYLAWDFTVASERDRSERLLHLRDDAFAKLGDTTMGDRRVQGRAPQFQIDEDSVVSYADGPIARKVTGTFEVPCYLDKPGCPTGSRFAYAGPRDTIPVALPGNTQTARFTCYVPRSALSGPARPSLYGHGLLGSQSEVGAGNVRSMASEHNIVFCATDWYGMAFEDLPSVATILADVSNFPLLADRVQQGILAQLHLGRLMVHPEGFAAAAAFRNAAGQPVLDTRRLFYDGNSQGGIIGGALMAVVPDAERGVLGVPGMNYSILLNRSVDFESDPENPCPPDPFDPPDVDPLDPPDDPEDGIEALGVSYACPLYASYPNHLDRQLLFSLLQQLWDRAEANGYAHHMTSDPLPDTPRHQVLLHVALGDHQVAQVAAEIEARTIGAAVRPFGVDAGRTFDLEPHWGIERVEAWPHSGSLYELWDSGPIREGGLGTAVPPAANVPPREGRDPHSEPRATISARVQKSEFLRIGGTAVDVCGGAPCYSRGWKGSR